MKHLARRHPLFHREADFQHAFAWLAHELEPAADVRLERRLSAETNERVDLLLVVGDLSIAVELNYPLAELHATVIDEPFIQRAHGADDVVRFNYVWDIVRLERLVDGGVAHAGVAVLLTNVAWLWQPRKTSARGPAADTEFSVHDGRELTGQLSWTGTATWWRIQKLPEAVHLRGRYPMRWQLYSTVDGDGRGEVRWTSAVVTKQHSPA